MDLNRAEIIGRLTRDPEIRQTPNGLSVVSFTVVTNYYKKDASGERVEMPEFHNCVAWGGLAETISKYLRKGSRGFFSGRLQTRNWDDPDGVRRYKTELVVTEMQMLDTKSSSSDYSNDNSYESKEDPASLPPDDDNEASVSIEDVPF